MLAESCSSSTNRISSRSSAFQAGSSAFRCTVARTCSGVRAARCWKNATWTPHSYAQPHRAHVRSMTRSEEHTSELQSRLHLVCRLLLEKKKKNIFEQNTRELVCLVSIY